MADAAAAEIGITIRARDQTSPAFTAATKGAEALEKKFNGLSGAVKALPGYASKASGALNALGTAAGQMGGKAAQVAGQFSGLAGLFIAGGPLGAGVAVAVGAFMAFSEIMERAAEAAGVGATRMSMLDEAMRSSADRARSLKDEIASLDDQLLAIGRSPLEAKMLDTKLAMADLQSQIATLEEDFAKLAAQSETAGFFEASGVNQAIVKTHELLEAKRVEMSLLADKLRALSELKEATEAQAQAEKKPASITIDLDAAAAEWGKALDQQKKDAIKRIDEGLKARLAAIEEGAAAELRIARDTDAQLQIIDQERHARAERIGAALQDVSGDVAAAMMANDQKAKNAAIGAAIDAASAIIVAEAAAGAAKAIEAHAGIPFVGPIIGGIAAGLISAMILAFKSKVAGYERGGYTGDGPWHEPAGIVHKGEYVVPAPIVAQVRRGMGMVDARQSTSPIRQGDTFHVNVGVQALDLSSISDVQLARVAKTVGQKIETLKARNVVRPAR